MEEFTAKTVEEAIENGLKELGLTKDNAEIVILEEPVKKLFGGKKARVSIGKKRTDGERTVEFLQELLKYMDAPVETKLVEEGDNIVINLETETSSSIIGYRGEILDALQCLAGAVANIGRENYRRTVVNCEGYREKREETLEKLAKKLAEKAIRTGRKVSLEPMNSFERRIIHSTLAETEGVKTHSEGKEPNRFIVIVPDNLKENTRNDRKYNGKGNRYNNNGRGEKKNYNRQGGRPASNKTMGWGGTFLGNSLKDGNKTEE